jgi:hypothetical protein
MAVTARPCKNATISFNDGSARTFTGIVDASVSLSMDAIETTEMASSWKTFTDGVKSGTATGNIFYDQDDATVAQLETAFKNGTEVTFTWTWHSSATWSAKARFTALSVSLAMNDIAKASFTAQLSEAVTISA